MTTDDPGENVNQALFVNDPTWMSSVFIMKYT